MRLCQPDKSGESLDQAEVLTEGVTRDDKVLVISLAVISSLLAGLMLQFLPAKFLDFQWKNAAVELGWLMTSVSHKVDVSLMVRPRDTLILRQRWINLTCLHKFHNNR